jgi:nucleoside-diphosphate-sugar epimerase
LIRRFYDAKEQGAESVVIWGTGTPRREFLFVDDMAEASLFLMDMPDSRFLELVHDAVTPLVNIGFGSDVSIRELAELICEIVGYSGSLKFDTSRPDGTPQKLLDVSRMKSLGWKAGTSLADGIEKTYNWFLDHQVDYRSGTEQGGRR